MGRSKETVRPNEKLKGRNELISDYIQRLTGVRRDRKQVSSHIQVLKEFVKHNPKSRCIDLYLMQALFADTHSHTIFRYTSLECQESTATSISIFSCNYRS